jgi:hypothetical protein
MYTFFLFFFCTTFGIPKHIHQGLVLRASCVTEKVRVKKKCLNQKGHSHKKKKLKQMEINQPNGVRPKIEDIN